MLRSSQSGALRMVLPPPHLRMPRKRNTSPSGSVYFAPSSAEVPQIWALLVAFTAQDRLGHALRSRAGRVDEHW
jgi:hypothetical protein